MRRPPTQRHHATRPCRTPALAAACRPAGRTLTRWTQPSHDGSTRANPSAADPASVAREREPFVHRPHLSSRCVSPSCSKHESRNAPAGGDRLVPSPWRTTSRPGDRPAQPTSCADSPSTISPSRALTRGPSRQVAPHKPAGSWPLTGPGPDTSPNALRLIAGPAWMCPGYPGTDAPDCRTQPLLPSLCPALRGPEASECRTQPPPAQRQRVHPPRELRATLARREPGGGQAAGAVSQVTYPWHPPGGR